jgi:hypothetical protein
VQVSSAALTRGSSCWLGTCDSFPPSSSRPSGPDRQALLEHGLVDELRLSIHPVMVGIAQVLFRDGQKQADVSELAG